MLRLTFTDLEKRALAYERCHHPHPQVRRKIDVLWLKSQGLAHQDIARLAGVSPKTLRSYFRDYREGGIAGLKVVHFRGPQSELNQFAFNRIHFSPQQTRDDSSDLKHPLIISNKTKDLIEGGLLQQEFGESLH